MLRQLAPVSPPSIADNHETVIALQNMSTFQDINPIHNPVELLRIQTLFIQEEQVAEQALLRIRTRRAETSHTYHDAVVGIGDGAHWIWNSASAHFPQAIQIVDW